LIFPVSHGLGLMAYRLARLARRSAASRTSSPSLIGSTNAVMGAPGASDFSKFKSLKL
jgi:hypothetical protein